MNYWLISDTHFGHRNMELESYCSRPKLFEDMILRHLLCVKPEDVLIHLGDICIGKDEDWNSTLHTLVKGKKILVRGNHDSKSLTWYTGHGWDFVCDSFSLNICGKNILFSHRPVPENGYDINIHGHCHNNEHRDDERTNRGKQILISMELNNYMPYSLRKTVDRFVAKEKKQ